MDIARTASRRFDPQGQLPPAAFDVRRRLAMGDACRFRVFFKTEDGPAFFVVDFATFLASGTALTEDFVRQEVRSIIRSASVLRNSGILVHQSHRIVCEVFSDSNVHTGCVPLLLSILSCPDFE